MATCLGTNTLKDVGFPSLGDRIVGTGRFPLVMVVWSIASHLAPTISNLFLLENRGREMCSLYKLENRTVIQLLRVQLQQRRINAGNIFVGSIGSMNMGTYSFVTKLDSNGLTLWTKELGVIGKHTYGMEVSADPQGNVFVAGRTSGSLDGVSQPVANHGFIVKYDPSGVKLWIRQVGADDGEIQVWGLTSDLSGNSYLTGTTYGTLNDSALIAWFDAFIISYNPLGEKR